MSPTRTLYPYQAQYHEISVAANPPPQTALGFQFYYQKSIGPQQQYGSPHFIEPSQYDLYSQVYPGRQQPAQWGSRGSFTAESRIPSHQRARGGPGRPRSVASASNPSSVVLGPPRKPRQSGHAIWIGNLPPQTRLTDLVQHVCKQAPGLESLFLISKSKCAFANFKDEAICAAAQAKIHGSRFQRIELVSRLRVNSVGTSAGVSAPTGPAALTPLSPGLGRTLSSESGSISKDVGAESNELEPKDSPKDKFFVVKSLTVESLELSVRRGVWATQSHNETILNKAYQTADNVYLIFSANHSGEYFGYARMASLISEDPAAAIEFAPRAYTVEDAEPVKVISTPATQFAPRGRIIDDLALGTIFWEVERDGEGEDYETSSNKSSQDLGSLASKAVGKPFKIEWLLTTRLPFYRARGLRNPWNSNREVKIARDGTELETAIGRRLIRLFHQILSPVAQPVSQIHGQIRSTNRNQT